MMKCESQTDSPLYSIHGIFPFDPDPPLDVNYKQIVHLFHFPYSKESSATCDIYCPPAPVKEVKER